MSGLAANAVSINTLPLTEISNKLKERWTGFGVQINMKLKQNDWKLMKLSKVSFSA